MRLIFILFILFSGFIFSQNNSQPKPEDTEIWEPIPKSITPGALQKAPSDAIVLFDGSSLSQWKSSRSGGPADWTINSNGSMTVKPGSGDIETIAPHNSVQLHLEWMTPVVITGDGQGRGNSGVIFQRRYEVQILDSYENRTYSNGQAASVYKQYVPLVNASLPPGQWQTYDIVFNAPEYNAVGDEIKPGYFTVFHNGVLVHNHVEIQGTTEYIGPPKKGRDAMPGYTSGGRVDRTLLLQDHGNLVQYRNIWMRKL